MKNSKGISMITLIITIVVIIILSSIAIVVSENGIDMALDARYQNERKELSDAVISRFAGYLRNSSTYPLEGASVPAIFDESLSNADKEAQALSQILEYLKTSGSATAGTDDVKNEISKILHDNINHIKYTRIIGSSEMLSLGLSNLTSDINYVYIVNYYSADVIGPIN